MDLTKKKLLKHMKVLTEFHSAPGFESDLKAYIKMKWNLMLTILFIIEWAVLRSEAFKNLTRKKVMVAAHMDEVGFMITHIADNGMIQFTNLGGVAADIWQGQRLKVKIVIMKSSLAWLQVYRNISRLVMKVYQKLRTMLDIGSASAAEVRARGIEIGDSIVPDTDFIQLSEQRFCWESLG